MFWTVLDGCFFLDLEVLPAVQECFEAPLPLALKGNMDFAPRK